MATGASDTWVGKDETVSLGMVHSFDMNLFTSKILEKYDKNGGHLDQKGCPKRRKCWKFNTQRILLSISNSVP